jgi:hypothetical protein
LLVVGVVLVVVVVLAVVHEFARWRAVGEEALHAGDDAV